MYSYLCSMKDEKFLQILESASHLYFTYGIKSITMDDVAKECNISKKTLYKYVSDKADLVEKTVSYVFSVNGKKMKDIVESKLNAIEELYEVQTILLNIASNYNPSIEYDLKKYYPSILRKIEDTKAEHIYNMMYRNLEKGKKENLYRKDFDSAFIAKLRVLIVLSKIDDKIVSYKDFMNEDAINEMLKYHLHAVCNETGLKLMKEIFTTN